MFNDFPVPLECGGTSCLPNIAAFKYKNNEDSRISGTTVFSAKFSVILYFLHRAVWYNYTTQTNEMHNFINQYLISVLCFMFRTSWVHPQGDSFICSMVSVTCIGVSSLVGGRENTTMIGAKT